MSDYKCLDCRTETFHENKLCTNCYDRRFNDPARVLPNGEIKVQGPAPNPPVPPSAERLSLLLRRFWSAIIEGSVEHVRQEALALQDRGISLAPVLREQMARIENPTFLLLREVALAIFERRQL